MRLRDPADESGSVLIALQGQITQVRVGHVMQRLHSNGIVQSYCAQNCMTLSLQAANCAVQAQYVQEKNQTMSRDESVETAHIFGITQRLSVTKLQPHQNSSQVKNILDPVKGLRDKLARYHSQALMAPAELSLPGSVCIIDLPLQARDKARGPRKKKRGCHHACQQGD